LNKSNQPLPFILKVAVKRKKKSKGTDDGIILFRRTAQLSGLSLTREGNDIELSDFILVDL
jgi:hypothetical protein